MLAKRSSFVALCVGLALLHGCKRQTDSDLTLTHEVSPQPPRVGLTTITLRLTNASGKPVTGARIRLEGNMSHAGMVPIFADAAETEPGRYLSTLELSMAGDWHVLVHVALANDVNVERQFEIKGVASE